MAMRVRGELERSKEYSRYSYKSISAEIKRRKEEEKMRIEKEKEDNRRRLRKEEEEENLRLEEEKENEKLRYEKMKEEEKLRLKEKISRCFTNYQSAKDVEMKKQSIKSFLFLCRRMATEYEAEADLLDSIFNSFFWKHNKNKSMKQMSPLHSTETYTTSPFLFRLMDSWKDDCIKNEVNYKDDNHKEAKFDLASYAAKHENGQTNYAVKHENDQTNYAVEHENDQTNYAVEHENDQTNYAVEHENDQTNYAVEHENDQTNYAVEHENDQTNYAVEHKNDQTNYAVEHKNDQTNYAVEHKNDQISYIYEYENDQANYVAESKVHQVYDEPEQKVDKVNYAVQDKTSSFMDEIIAEYVSHDMDGSSFLIYMLELEREEPRNAYHHRKIYTLISSYFAHEREKTNGIGNIGNILQYIGDGNTKSEAQRNSKSLLGNVLSLVSYTISYFIVKTNHYFHINTEENKLNPLHHVFQNPSTNGRSDENQKSKRNSNTLTDQSNYTNFDNDENDPVTNRCLNVLLEDEYEIDPDLRDDIISCYLLYHNPEKDEKSKTNSMFKLLSCLWTLQKDYNVSPEFIDKLFFNRLLQCKIETCNGLIEQSFLPTQFFSWLWNFRKLTVGSYDRALVDEVIAAYLTCNGSYVVTDTSETYSLPSLIAFLMQKRQLNFEEDVPTDLIDIIISSFLKYENFSPIQKVRINLYFYSLKLDISKINIFTASLMTSNDEEKDPQILPIDTKELKNVIKSIQFEKLLGANDTNRSKGLRTYAMESKPVGKCLIFSNMFKNNVILFDCNIELTRRSGTEHDVKSLENTFKWLGFDVKIYLDKSREEMMDILVLASAEEDECSNDCFVCCILSHGYEGGIYASDGGRVSILDVINCVNGENCRKLVDKPKLFFVQACQGDTPTAVVPIPVLAEQLQLDGPPPLSVPSKCLQMKTLPSQADISFFMATTPGQISWRDPKTGSWFIQKLCAVLQQYAEHNSLDDIFTMVNNEIADIIYSENINCRQISHLRMHTLRKKLYFVPEISFNAWMMHF